MTEPLKSKSYPRIAVVDALRGFAVLGILITHSIEHFIFNSYPDPASQPEWLNILDSAVFNIVFSLFAGKAYAIFALLFGFTFFIQFSNQQARNGSDFGYRFLWRLVLLAGFASLNALFFPAGDVLLLFSIVGVFLFVVRHLSSKIVFVLAILLLLQPVEWVHYIASLFNSAYSLPDLGVGEMYTKMTQNTAKGNWVDFLWLNISLGQKASLFWAIGAGRFLQTAGLFMLGMLIGRKQLFVSTKENTRFWVRTLIVSAILFCPLYQLKVLGYDNIAVDNASLIMTKQTVGVVLDMWQKLAFTLVLVSSFVLLYRSKNFQKRCSRLSMYGKMSMTNYISQSVLGALIYFPVGLHLAPYCGYTLSLFIGIAIFIVQGVFCKWWLSKHKRGPLEEVWARLTWIGSNKLKS